MRPGRAPGSICSLRPPARYWGAGIGCVGSERAPGASFCSLPSARSMMLMLAFSTHDHANEFGGRLGEPDDQEEGDHEAASSYRDEGRIATEKSLLLFPGHVADRAQHGQTGELREHAAREEHRTQL